MKRIVLAVAALLVCAGASPALAQTAPTNPAAEADEAVLTGGDVNIFGFGSYIDYFPADALEHGVSGASSVLCLVGSKGKLTGCVLEAETPAGAGFGPAAVKLTAKARVSARTADGRPTEGRKFRFAMQWRAPAPPPR